MRAAPNAVFLSYASQDADAARKICEALRGAGVEVWFDQNQLVGGDAWDQKIRGQIASCGLFLAVISGNTQSRREGYFRLEWKLAAQRTHMMSERTAFLLPVVVDATRDAEADVPSEFKAVQWTRLPGGETPAAFCERVKVLLGGDGVARAFPRVEEHENTRWKARTTSAPPHARRWLVPAIASVAAIVALAIWQPWKVQPPEATLSAPLTEARQLTLKARALIDDDWMAGRENFRLAEEFCLKAVALDVTDGEAWATLARVSVEILARRYESSPQRRESARRQAERAIRLRPDSVEAGLAMASHSVETGSPADAERRFRQLLVQAPGDPRLVLGLARALARTGRFDEASAVRLNHPAFGERDPRPFVQESIRLRARGKLEEGHALLERAQSLAPSLRGYTYLLLSYVSYFADFEAARALVETMPAQVLQEDAVACLVAQLWLRLGDGERAQEVLRRIPRDFLQEENQEVPKGFMMGWALKISGKAAAAQAEWAQALTVVEKRLESEPNRAVLVRYRAELLALTGRVAEGVRWWKVASEFSREPNANSPYHSAMFLASAGNVEESVDWLVRTPPADLQVWQRTSVRFDPAFAEVRRDPKVQRMIAEWAAATDALRAARKATNARPSVDSADGSGLAGSNSKLQTQNSEPSRPAVDAKSVAVLAFANIPDDKSNEYFSDGISEELLNVLAKIPGLKVTARTSAFHFKGKDLPIPEIAKQLGVAYVVEGSVRKIDTQLRISARLLNGTDGTQMWADDFREELKDVFALQDKIAGLIAKNLALKLGTGTSGPLATAAPTKNLEAYDAYLRGRALQTGGMTLPNQQETVRLFEKAVGADENYALAWARLAQAHLWTISRGPQDRSEPTVGNARKAAQTAVRLAPDLPEARLAMAGVFLHIDRDHEAAQRELDAAERLQANNPEIFAARAGLEYVRGKWGQGLVDLVMRSIELDPQNAEPHEFGTLVLSRIGRFAETEQLSRRWSAIAPTLVRTELRRSENHLAWTGNAHEALVIIGDLMKRVPVLTEFPAVNRVYWVLELRAALYEAAGDTTSAIADYERFREARMRFGTMSYRIARLEAKRGNRARAAELNAEALTLVRERLERTPEDVPALSALARIHAARQEKSEAMEAMEKAIRLGERNRDASRAANLRESKAEMLATLGELDAAVAELRALHEMGWGFGYMLRRAIEWEPLLGNAKFQQLMKEAEARADAQPRPR